MIINQLEIFINGIPVSLDSFADRFEDFLEKHLVLIEPTSAGMTEALRVFLNGYGGI